MRVLVPHTLSRHDAFTCGKKGMGDGWAAKPAHPSPIPACFLERCRHVDRSLHSMRSGDICLTYHEVNSSNSNLHKVY